LTNISGQPRHNQVFSRLGHLLVVVLLLLPMPSLAIAREGVSLAASLRSAEAFRGKTISTVEVKGLKRIEKDAVVAKLTSKPGQVVSREDIRADIQALFNMGYFDEVEVQGEVTPSGTVNLIYQLKERPVISSVEFEGNERISTSDLQEVVKVKEWSILDLNKVREDTSLIQKHYEEKGFYLAKVRFEVKQVKSDEVQLTYKISDYEKVQIKKITFLNNRAYTDNQLKATFAETKEGGFFSFMTNSGNFKESSFKTDLQRLTYWYLDHGYVKFRYENPIVTVSDDKRWLYITIYLDEGDQYKMDALDFGGDLLFPKENLGSEVTLIKDDVFSISKRNSDIQRLTEKYQDEGYAFVNVIPKMNIKDETKTVDIQYDFEKGNLTYFGDIVVIGNTKTHDKVIRRELKIQEGELFNGTRLRESRENVERLGYFAPGEVIFNQVTPKGRPDVVNIEISVKERSTGTVTLGAGVGSAQGLFFTGQVAEINLMGRGQTLSLSTQIAASRESKSFNLGFTEPYTFDTLWSSGFDLYFVSFPIPGKYTTRKLGFDVRFGHPIIEFTNAYITYKNEGLKIEGDQEDLATLDQQDLKADQGVLSSVIWQVVRDKRNNRFETTAGDYQSVSLETAGVGGDKSFVKWIFNARYYRKLIGDLVFRTSGEYGQIAKVEERPIPPSERFYLGGPNNLKGYQPYTVGPSRVRPVLLRGFDGSTSTALVREPKGGNIELLALFELEYPLIREAGIKAVVFYDAGNAYDDFPNLDDFTIRTDAGFGIRWFSPIGPLRFEVGFPFSRRPGEDESVFQFFIGPPF